MTVETPRAPLHMWLADPLPEDACALLARLRQTPDVQSIAVMPDVHLAAEFCVGTVVATTHLLFPNAVGGDIGCGLLALGFDASADLLRDRQRAAQVLAALYEVVPARRHHRALAPPLSQELRALPLSHPHLEPLRKSGGEAHLQLGTLGSGNHFLELQSDEATDRLWLMIHSGSRQAGQVIHHRHLPRAAPTATGLLALDADTPDGQAYLADLTWARAYAAANRRAMAEAVARALEALFHVAPLADTLLDTDHNHLQREAHGGTALFIHRKGASAAALGQPGLIPGSMATASFHTVGRGHAPSLNSSSHGAGRALSRAQARARITTGHLKQQLAEIWYDHRLTTHLREEAPAAYKDIHAVMAAQAELTTVARRLRPLLNYKGL